MGHRHDRACNASCGEGFRGREGGGGRNRGQAYTTRHHLRTADFARDSGSCFSVEEIISYQYTSIYRLSCIRKASVFEKLSVHPLARTPPRKPTRKNTSRYRKCACLVSVRDMGGIVVSMGPPSPVHHLRAHATQVVPDVPLTRGVADHPLLGDGLDTQPCQRQEEGGG